MKIFVINLDRRPDRLERIAQSLKTLGLDFERIPAFDGQKLPPGNFVYHVRAGLYEPFQGAIPGAVGCFLSHRKIWQKMVDENIDQALVFEDDARIVDWDDDILDVSLKDNNLDLLRIGANIHSKKQQVMDKIYRKPVVISDDRIRDRALTYDCTSGSHAYIITREGAKKCLKCERYWFHMDHYFIWTKIYKVRTALIIPPMVVASGPDSDINHKSVRRTDFFRRMQFNFVQLLPG